MVRLKERNKQIPNGFTFVQPETKWKAPKFASFDTIVSGLLMHRQANPFLVQKYSWPTDRLSVEEEVDFYNARICQSMGWKDYIVTDEQVASPPKSLPLRQAAGIAAGARAMSSGVQNISAWLGQGGKPVAQELAEARAAVCVSCPRNEQGDWTRFFTQPAAALVKRQIEHRNGLKLTTSHDDELRICGACLCPLKLKCFVTLDVILKHLQNEQRDRLHESCWILSESLEKEKE